MSLKQFYTSETEVPTELKSYYTEKNGRFELQVEGFESVPAVFSKNQELITRQQTDSTKIQELTAKATQVNSLTQELANKNSEISKLSNDVTKAQSNTVPTGYVAVQKKDVEIIEKIKEQNLDVNKVAEVINEIETVKKENADYKLEKSILDFAKAENISNVGALTRFIKEDGVKPIVKEVEENGKKVNRGFLVKIVDEKEVESPYQDYKTANWSAVSKALDEGNQPIRGMGHDPKVSGFNPDDEGAKKAQQSQAQTTHSFF